MFKLVRPLSDETTTRGLGALLQPRVSWRSAVRKERDVRGSSKDGEVQGGFGEDMEGLDVYESIDKVSGR